MLFIALIFAACLYVGLFLLWEASQAHLNGPINVLQLINNMVMAPRYDIFFLLRSLIFITFMYVVSDFIYSTIRRTKKKLDNKAEETAQAEKAKGKQSKPVAR